MLKSLFLILIIYLLPNSLNGGIKIFVSSASEISSAMQTAAPGDTLIMTNGFWTNQRIIFAGNGTQTENIVLRAETSGKVILNGSSTLRIAGSHLTVIGLYFYKGASTSGAVIEFRNGSSNLATNCRLSETVIENYNPTSKSTDYKWISLYGQYNRVDHCFVKGKAHSGTTLVVWLNGQPNYHLIDNNYFGFRPELGVNGGETIRIGTSTYSMTDSYTTVENNYFEHCNGEIEIISNKSGHNTFRYNTFYECEGALTLRHGNFAEVYGNYFIGNNKSLTGGVRIIGEDHKVYNNYFENLRGTSFRAALTMVNGVPNSPLNRYFQVKRAEVINNTFVNCDETFNIGAGSDSERTLPPLDCKISNNIAFTTFRIFDYEDTPINMTFEKNIMFDGPLGIPETNGIQTIDPQLIEDTDGLWRISENSPARDFANSSYSYIVDDMDGQLRIDLPDIGADEYSLEPIMNRPLNADSTGPSWYPVEIPPIKILQVYAGQDSLKKAIEEIMDDEIIELMSDGGIYSNTGDLEITKRIKIRAKHGLSSKPIIINNDESGTDRSIFVIKSGGSLELNDVELDGLSNSNTPANYLIRTDELPMAKSYKLKIDSCYLHDVSNNDNGNFFYAYPGTFADTVLISNSLLTNSGSIGISMKDEGIQSRNYNVNYFEIYNSTFWNIPKEAVYLYAGDNILFTPGPIIRIDQSTFDNCGFDNSLIINPDECDDTYISNSIFSNNISNTHSISLFGNIASISHCNLFETGEILLNRSASLGNGMISVDPLYENSLEGNFSLPSNSLVLNKSSNGGAIGDLRWAIFEPSYYSLKIAIFGEGEVETVPSNDTYDFDKESTVTLNAIPNTGYKFVQWSGDLEGTDNNIQILMDSNKEIIAVFELIVNVTTQNDIPNEFNLYQNYPNPFNPSTFISYGIPYSSNVKIDLYSMNGELIENLVDKYHTPGKYVVDWNGSKLSSGTYFVRMESDGKYFVNKISLIK